MVDTLEKYLREKQYTQSSIAAYTYAVEKYLRWTEAEQIESEYATYTELLSYIQHLRKNKNSQRTIQNQMVAISHYYESLIKAEITETNPARYIEISIPQALKLYPILTKEQLENLHTDFNIKGKRKTKPTAYLSAVRNKVAVGLMVYQGLDTTALSRLTTEDIDVLSGTIRIRGSRTYNERTLALHATQIIELDRYINQTRKELQHYFNNLSAGAEQESEALLITGYSKYTDAHKRLMQRLRKQQPQLQSVQQIKTSVITGWLKQYNLREVQYMAGHRHVHSTEAYKHNDTEGLKMDIDKFHPMR